MSTLKNLVNETTNIKNELAECHNNLKNNLIEKGVECSDSDKISNLIDKISTIAHVIRVDKGSGSIYENSNSKAYTVNAEVLHDSYVVRVPGTITAAIKGWSDVSNNHDIIVRTERNGVVVFDKTTSISSYNETSPKTVSFAIQDIKSGDIVKAYIKKGVFGSHFTVTNFKITGNYILG